jgi:hypothetical protein
MNSGRSVGSDYRMPESFNAFCSIVSLTAAKTSRIFEVSVACVRLHRSVTSKWRRHRGHLTEDTD